MSRRWKMEDGRWGRLVGLSCLVALSCAAATPVAISLQHFTGSALNRKVTLTPVTNPQVQSTNFVAGMPLVLTPVNGLVTTNLVTGDYTMTIDGINKSWTLSVPDTNVVQSASALQSTVSTYSWTNAQGVNATVTQVTDGTNAAKAWASNNSVLVAQGTNIALVTNTSTRVVTIHGTATGGGVTAQALTDGTNAAVARAEALSTQDTNAAGAYADAAVGNGTNGVTAYLTNGNPTLYNPHLMSTGVVYFGLVDGTSFQTWSNGHPFYPDEWMWWSTNGSSIWSVGPTNLKAYAPLMMGGAWADTNRVLSWRADNVMVSDGPLLSDLPGLSSNNVFTGSNTTTVLAFPQAGGNNEAICIRLDGGGTGYTLYNEAIPVLSITGGQVLLRNSAYQPVPDWTSLDSLYTSLTNKQDKSTNLTALAGDNGGGLTNLNASALSSGTISVNLLPSGVTNTSKSAYSQSTNWVADLSKPSELITGDTNDLNFVHATNGVSGQLRSTVIIIEAGPANDRWLLYPSGWNTNTAGLPPKLTNGWVGVLNVSAYGAQQTNALATWMQYRK